MLKNLRSSHRELDRRRQSGGVRLSIRRLPEMIANTIPQSVSLRLTDSPLCTRGPTITIQLLKPPLCKRRWHGVSRDGGIVYAKLPIYKSCKMIALQSLTRCAGAPFAQGSLFGCAVQELSLL